MVVETEKKGNSKKEDKNLDEYDDIFKDLVGN